MKIGLTGGGLTGKSTVFDALTRSAAQAAKGRFQTRIGSAKVPDERLEQLAQMYSPKKVVNAEISYTELPNPVRESDIFAGEALGSIQKMDALALVVRAFENSAAPHPAGSVDYMRDLEQLMFDMRFQDIALLERRIARIKAESKAIPASARGAVERQLATLAEIQAALEGGASARSQEWGDAQREAVGDTFLVSRIPLLVVVNIGEDDIPRAEEVERRVGDALKEGGTGVVALCAQLERELGEMEPEDEAEMRRGMGAGESALARFISHSYSVLGLISFLTAGEDEVRAWPVPRGSTALDGARAIHSDIARGFIRAEVIACSDLLRAGGMAEARKLGLLRQEGREYIIQDGDIANYLFSI